MNSRITAIAVASVLAVGAIGTAAFAGWFDDEIPPDNAKPLSGMIRGLEDQGFTKITDVDYDDGVYSIEAHQSGKEIHFKFDAISGKPVR
jgi:hypothetical protein